MIGLFSSSSLWSLHVLFLGENFDYKSSLRLL